MSPDQTPQEHTSVERGCRPERRGPSACTGSCPGPLPVPSRDPDGTHRALPSGSRVCGSPGPTHRPSGTRFPSGSVLALLPHSPARGCRRVWGGGFRGCPSLGLGVCSVVASVRVPTTGSSGRHGLHVRQGVLRKSQLHTRRRGAFASPEPTRPGPLGKWGAATCEQLAGPPEEAGRRPQLRAGASTPHALVSQGPRAGRRGPALATGGHSRDHADGSTGGGAGRGRLCPRVPWPARRWP